jgi:hypothetical protein
MYGIGKSTLFQHLTLEAYRHGYLPPQRSQTQEKGRLPEKPRVALSVVPGQHATPRLSTLDALLSGKDPVDGIIHVVANGFVATREAQARDVLVSEGLGTIEEYTAHFRRSEIDDLNSICDLIRGSIRRTKKPSWMIVAVTKADLFAEFLPSVAAYYSTDPSSPFVKRLEQLRIDCGKDNFRWQALPVCSWLEDFDWNGSVLKSTLKPYQRDYYITQLIQTVEAYCAD